jgi:uncharacterized glyoxalase superfamily protein PhnB
MAGQPNQGPATGLTPHLQVDDTDQWYDRAEAAGATIDNQE